MCLQYSKRCHVTNYLVKTMTSPPINLYHKHYAHTQMVIVEGCPLMISGPPFKNFLNEGLKAPLQIFLNEPC